MNMIPDWQAKLLENGKGANYGLYFSRMTAWRTQGVDLKTEYLARVVQTKKGPKEEYAPDIERLGERSLHILPTASVVLDAIHARQTSILKTEAARGGMVWEFRARLLSPFVSGLGSGHPTETGMILDRNSGLPYIPASGIKGVLRLAHALDIAEQYDNDKIDIPQDKEGNWVIDDRLPTMRRYFGDTNTGKSDSVRGQLVFLDAFPASTPNIKTDIMNPHLGAYYSGNQGPLETENPIPVKFLAVAETTEFIFRCFASPLPEQGQGAQVIDVIRPFDCNDEQSIIAMFTRAFDQLGFGGKTSIGYGRFVLMAKNTADHFKGLVAQDVERRLQEEMQRQQEEEIRRYPWRPLLAGLEQVNDWGMLRQKILDNKLLHEHQNQLEVGERVKAAAELLRTTNPKKWETSRDEILEKWLAPSGVAWPQKQQTPADTPSPTLSAEEQQQVDRIHSLKDWGQFKQAQLQVGELSLPAAEALKEKFLGWGLKTQKNEEKKKTWKALEAHLRKMK